MTPLRGMSYLRNALRSKLAKYKTAMMKETRNVLMAINRKQVGAVSVRKGTAPGSCGPDSDEAGGPL